MIGLIQRVTRASVAVGGDTIGKIDAGLLVLVGVEKEDDSDAADSLLHKLLSYRVFADDDDKMNLSLKDTGGGLLIVPQFTLAANTNKGMRPSFSSAAPPDQGRRLYEHLVTQALHVYPHIETGRFGADMEVSLVNDGPVTFWLQV